MANVPSFSSILYDCATECALRRQKGICDVTWGCEQCLKCHFYTANYIDADPRQLALFNLQAESRATAMRYSDDPGRMIIGTFLVLLIIGIGFVVYQCAYAAPRDWKELEQRYAPKATVQQVPITNNLIDTTLTKVKQELETKRTDVNGDGQLNCIDAAVLFYKYYPNRNEVCIEVNKHPTNGWHHLFNCVLVDGAWRAVEPQAYLKGWNSYWIRDVWGSTYDVTYNRDVTAEYKKYVK